MLQDGRALSSSDFDYLVIGAGISGASAGYELAQHGRTLIVDMESAPGYHSTGRSAALYTPNYGPDLVRSINKLSYAFLSSPPDDFSTAPLLSPRGMMTVVPHDHAHMLDALLEQGGKSVEAIDVDRALEYAPFLRKQNVHAAVYEDGVNDMDVSALHQGYLRGFKQRGGVLIGNSPVSALRSENQSIVVTAKGMRYRANTVINAAGAWAENVGALAGAKPIGLQPMRRTAILIDAPATANLATVPAIDFYGVDNYLKPEPQQLMASPGDATHVDAQDVQPEDLDVAKLVDWLERETTIEVKRVNHQWAGLRSFTPCGTPVVGFDPLVENFFWLAGQGGYGIMMASALGRAVASVITNNYLPEDFKKAGIDLSSLAAT